MFYFWSAFFNIWRHMTFFSIYVVHDEVKDKDFELELSWVGANTNGVHQFVPREVFTQAEKYAKVSFNNFFLILIFFYFNWCFYLLCNC